MAVLASNGGPEGVTVGRVDLVQAGEIDVRRVVRRSSRDRRQGSVKLQALLVLKDGKHSLPFGIASCSRNFNGLTRHLRRLLLLLRLLLLRLGNAVVGLGQDSSQVGGSSGVHDARQADGTAGRGGRTGSGAPELRDGAESRLTAHGAATEVLRVVRHGRRARQVALAAVASVRDLVIVQAAGELSLVEVGSDVLVGHLLHPGLEEVLLLWCVVSMVLLGEVLCR